jgi:hypothetical protein
MARTSPRLRPLATHKLPVLAQKRLRRHHQSVAPAGGAVGRSPQATRDQLAQEGSPLLPSEHGQLVSQHEQLDLFGDLAPPAADQQPQHGREGEMSPLSGATALVARVDHEPPEVGQRPLPNLLRDYETDDHITDADRAHPVPGLKVHLRDR